MSPAQHTAAPWMAYASTAGFWIVARGELEDSIAYAWATNGQPAKANAEFIANACNAHHDLVDAVKSAIKESWEPQGQGGVVMPAWVFDRLQAALKKAGVAP